MISWFRLCMIPVVGLFFDVPTEAAFTGERDFLMNPVLTSRQAIDTSVETYQDMLTPLERRQRQGTLTDEENRLRTLIRLFLIFAGPGLDEPGVEAGRGKLIDLSRSEDPAVVLLRERIQIPAPEGFVFVRTFSSVDVMPIDLLAAFAREHTRGVTLLSRYIAMVEQRADEPARQRFYDHQQDAILSHELVHAYINTVLAETNGRDLPVWFHEGCATYLSDSPGGKPVTRLVETPLGYRYVTYEDKAPWDYRQYKRVFDYFEARFGRSGVYEHIRRVVETGTIDTLLAEVNAETPTDLIGQAEHWHRNRQRRMYALSTAVIVVCLLWLWYKLPKERKNIEPIV